MTHNKVSFNASLFGRTSGSMMCAFNQTPPPHLLNNSKTYSDSFMYCKAPCNAFSCHQRAHRLADQLHRCAHPCHGTMTPKDGHILLPTSFVGVSLFLGHSLKNHTFGQTYNSRRRLTGRQMFINFKKEK